MQGVPEGEVMAECEGRQHEFQPIVARLAAKHGMNQLFDSAGTLSRSFAGPVAYRAGGDLKDVLDDRARQRVAMSGHWWALIATKIKTADRAPSGLFPVPGRAKGGVAERLAEVGQASEGWTKSSGQIGRVPLHTLITPG